MTYSQICERQVKRSIYCCWLAVEFRRDNGVVYLGPRVDIFFNLN